MSKTHTKLTADEAQRQAGLATLFQWEDEANERILDAQSVEIDYTAVLGTLREKVNGSPVFIVEVGGTAVSRHGYPYDIDETVSVRMGDDGVVKIDDASKEEIKEAEAHHTELRCEEYTTLMGLIHAGCYTEDFQGDYWDDDTNISEELRTLDEWAIAQGLHFVRKSTSEEDRYTLEPASKEELEAYEKALEEYYEDE